MIDVAPGLGHPPIAQDDGVVPEVLLETGGQQSFSGRPLSPCPDGLRVISEELHDAGQTTKLRIDSSFALVVTSPELIE